MEILKACRENALKQNESKGIENPDLPSYSDLKGVGELRLGDWWIDL